jgi:hypothetical protein
LARRQAQRRSAQVPDATIARIRPKQIQINPSKTKQKSLDLLGFIRPNRDFSRGYSESK